MVLCGEERAHIEDAKPVLVGVTDGLPTVFSIGFVDFAESASSFIVQPRR